MPRRVLFFPSYRGGGFGHISRCLALAEILDQNGWNVGFVLDGPHTSRVSRQWPVFRPAPHSLPMWLFRRVRDMLSHTKSGPAYLFFSDLSFQIVRDGFHTTEIIEQEVAKELEIVRRFQPDLLIGDAWFLTSILGRLADVPVVQIIRSAAHPAHPQLVWWRDVPTSIQAPDIAPVFNPALERWRLPTIQRAEDLLDGDLLLIPSIPALEPLPPGTRRTHYVGPLIRRATSHNLTPTWMMSLPHNRSLVYVTVGGGSDSSQQEALLELWVNVFVEAPWEVVISTGGRRVPRRFQQQVGNLHIFPWVPGPAVIARADVVLFHGGYGTTMETVQAGKPSVIFPFHTEQEGNGRRLESLELGHVVAPSDADFEVKRFTWRHQTLTTLVVPHLTRTAQQVRDAVRGVLTDDHYKENATRLQAMQAEYDARRLVLDALANLT